MTGSITKDSRDYIDLRKLRKLSASNSRVCMQNTDNAAQHELPPEPLKPEDCTVAHRQMQGERALAAFRNTHSPAEPQSPTQSMNNHARLRWRAIVEKCCKWLPRPWLPPQHSSLSAHQTSDPGRLQRDARKGHANALNSRSQVHLRFGLRGGHAEARSQKLQSATT